jgi:hypothetical protein
MAEDPDILIGSEHKLQSSMDDFATSVQSLVNVGSQVDQT